MIVTAAVAWALLASGIALYACFQMAGAQADARREKGWARHWREQANALTDYLSRTPSKRGRHARQSQIAQERARVLATAKRLESGR